MFDTNTPRPFGSWLRSFGGLFGKSRRKSARASLRRPVLRFETLESRSLLSVTLLPTISGTVYHDLNANGVDSGEPGVAGVTVTLFQDNGSGQFSTGDQVVGSTQTNASGKYQFANVPVGTYWVQQSPATGLALGAGQGPREVQVAATQTDGAFGTVIDAFNATSQLITASRSSGLTAAASAAAIEALGGERDLYAQLTSSNGALTLDANTNNPGAFEASYSGQATGTYQIIWDGKANETSVTNPTGLNHADLTSGGLSNGIGMTIGADHATAFTVLVYTDANDWSQASVTVPAGSGAAVDNVLVPFSSFTIGAGSGANFSNVGAVELQSNGGTAVQTELKLIGSLEPVQVAGPNFANVTQTDLAIVKSASPNPVIAGNTLTYTLVATDNGPSNATGVTITDTLPAGVTYASATSSQGTVSQSGGTVTVNVGGLADGATATATVLVTVSPTTRGSITNTAVVTGNEPDPNLANNTSTVTTQVNPLVNLAIVKSASPSPATAGNALTYTLLAADNGPSNATGVTITDTLPAGVTYTSATSSQGTVSQSGGTVTVKVGNMNAGATATATILVMVAPSTHGSITNTAVIAGNEPDPNMANNTSTVTTQVNAMVNLAIVKSASPSPVTAGSTLTYTLSATDNGPSNATGVTITDTLPAGVSYTSSTSSQGWVGQSGGTVTVNLGNMNAGATATATILVMVAPSTRGSITNTAVIAGNEPETNLANNTSTVTTQVNADADLSIAKTATPFPAIAGSAMTYTLTGTDLGPSNATGVTMTDTLPSGVTYASATSSQGTVSQTGGTVTVNVGNLSTGATATATILVTVNSGTQGTITNTAVIAGNEPDPDLSNNTASVTTMVGAQVNLSIAKSASPNPVIAGQSLSYTLTASDLGPSDATGVTVTDTLPAGVTYASGSSSQGSVSQSGGTVTVNLGNLHAGAAATATILVSVNPSTRGTITNTAVISGNEPETNLTNNTATVTTQVNALDDLSILKSASVSSVKIGASFTYTLTASNSGPSSATGVTITDALPAGLTFDSAQSSLGTVSQAGGTVTVNVGNLAVGGTDTVTIVVTLASGTGSFTNTAKIVGNEPETTLANNSASVTTFIVNVAPPPTDPPLSKRLYMI